MGAAEALCFTPWCQQGFDARGVEVNESLIADSRRLYGELPVQPVSGPLLPFPDSAFDTVLSFDVFEHIRDSDAHLREVRRVRRSRSIPVQTPNRWTNTISKRFGGAASRAGWLDHCGLHSYRQPAGALERHGFAVRFHDVPVVTEFFVRKLRLLCRRARPLLLRSSIRASILPLPMWTNFYVEATKGDAR